MKRKHSFADYFNLVIGLGVLIAMLVGGVYLIVNGIHEHKGGQVAGGVFLALIGGIVPVVLLGLLAQRGVRKAVPGSAPPKVKLTLDRSSFAPGEQITGRVDVVESGRARRLEVSLRRHDRTPDYQGVSFTLTLPPLASGELSAPASYGFSITLPADAVPTYAASGGSIWWDVDARCDVFGSDEHATEQITVNVQRLRQPEAV